MMTSLEARLSGADPAFARELHEQLVQAQGYVKRQLLRGGTPQQYREWQQQADAIEAGLTIIGKLKEHNHG
ncbi:TPA: EscE/YscE/SsaE family type III secretion system needle protein co-chaperone [Aeromonas hydrophila]|uniref:EscE/YscE/SsaE family type III secretion system needle protein co-chaperone n=1 Tax=Aeromonas hydrophila TaxID=644 RepID=UPI000FD159E0|nr:EscE/YscE/SsaE family type III secretion system needle protein co-chaperone [Aeromonas hydrophila]AZU48835.1 YseE family type III secretion system protein [Aeromonas hydrophila]MCV3294942.1 EscE/YscE/SsaE family type III secretion system needle protein co-chaperone [Aeromonas hydrophila]QBX70710.1 EscE/YscE/SsaE family type III secretion system needle protein co-chaperone [Aeromonas hydrophila]QBX75435.1 EscE/YscE/SsaE family type III secretion system needle protein co-chaperone [Aeromonas h